MKVKFTEDQMIVTYNKYYQHMGNLDYYNDECISYKFKNLRFDTLIITKKCCDTPNVSGGYNDIIYMVLRKTTDGIDDYVTDNLLNSIYYKGMKYENKI